MGDDPANGGGALPGVAASKEEREREREMGEHPTSHSRVLMGSQGASVVTKQRQPSDRYSTARINAGDFLENPLEEVVSSHVRPGLGQWYIHIGHP